MEIVFQAFLSYFLSAVNVLWCDGFVEQLASGHYNKLKFLVRQYLFLPDRNLGHEAIIDSDTETISPLHPFASLISRSAL
jgi:hypothetical protein